MLRMGRRWYRYICRRSRMVYGMVQLSQRRGEGFLAGQGRWWQSPQSTSSRAQAWDSRKAGRSQR